MSDGITVKDYATPALVKAGEVLENRRPLLMAVVGAVKKSHRAHFRARQAEDSRRKRKGWAPKYFWSGSRGQSVEEKTNVGEVTNDSATLIISSPEFSQKLRGGTIRPKRGKHLAIPLRAEAYAAGSPREWDAQTMRSELRLVPIRSKRGTLFLAQVGVDDFSGPLGSRGLRLQYLLVRSVTQKADPRALPPPAETAKVIDDAIETYMARRLRRGNK